MKLKLTNETDSLTPTLKAFRPDKAKVEKFDQKLQEYFQNVNSSESEENIKTHFMDILKSMYQPEYLVEQAGRVDFVIRNRNGKSNPIVLFETKHEKSPEMIRKNDINRKALHELVLYYMRERVQGNNDIRNLVIHTEYSVYIFDVSEFEKKFYRDPYFRRQFEDWRLGKKS